MNKVAKWLARKFGSSKPSNLQPSNLQPSNLQPSNLQPSNLQPSRFDWLGIEVPPPVVRRYFERVEGETLDVPLAVARQVREETVALIAKHTDADDRQVAVWQGIIAGMERFAAVYSRGVEMQREKIGPGGKRMKNGE